MIAGRTGGFSGGFPSIADIRSSWLLPSVCRVITFAALVAIGAPSSGQTDAKIAARITPALHACQSDPENGGTLQQAMCEADEAHRQEERLNRTWSRVIASLPPARQKAFRDSQRAWIRRREKDCRSEMHEYVNSTANYMFAACMVEETIRHTLWLENRLAKEPAQQR